MNRALLSGYLATKPDGGPECERLERELESYYHVKHARVLNSATSALHAALVAIGIGPGDEVLVPAYSMSASASAVIHAGATPVFCDVGDDYCLDWSDALARVSERTRAAVLVHLFGHHGYRTGAFRHPVIHDCAQSPSVVPTRQVETIPAGVQGADLDASGPLRLSRVPADCWVYSLNQHKIITCGEGGYVLTFSDIVADRIHAVRNHGECTTTDILGWNYRLTEPQAKIARAELADLDARLADRRAWAYAKRREHDLPEDPGNRDWFRYPIRVRSDRRDEYAMKVGGHAGYHKPLYELPYFKKRFPAAFAPNVELIESEIVVIDPLNG